MHVIDTYIITVGFDRKGDLLFGILEKYLSMKNIRVDDLTPDLVENKGLAETMNVKLIQMVKLIF